MTKSRDVASGSFNDGISVDNISIDGTEIDLSSGDLTVDVAGDIIFDADGGDFLFRDNANNEMTIKVNDGSNIDFISNNADHDIRFRGVDGSTTITALTLDMSDAGTAIFNNKVGIGTSSPDGQLHLFTSDASITPDADADDFIIEANGAAGMTIGSSASSVGSIRFADSGSPRAGMIYYDHVGNAMRLYTAATERMRITSGGDVQIGTTTARPDNYNGSGSGTEVSALGLLRIARNGDLVVLNRISTDGDFINFSKDASGFGQIGVSGGNNLYISGTATAHAGVTFATRSVLPSLEGALNDDGTDLGQNGNVFRDIYAGNTSISTSDQNKKQQIASLTDAEITAAKALSKLFKTFKWNDAVEAKGDNARTHTGVIAQQIETAMSDAGLDAGKYAFFISGTWWETQTEVAAVEADEENGIEAKDAYTRTDTYQTQEEAPEGATERNRKGIRYPELLAFIGAATEQRLTSIESRLTALEGE